MHYHFGQTNLINLTAGTLLLSLWKGGTGVDSSDAPQREAYLSVILLIVVSEMLPRSFTLVHHHHTDLCGQSSLTPLMQWPCNTIRFPFYTSTDTYIH